MPPEEDRGGEHTVSIDLDAGRYIKATRSDRFLGFGIHLNNTGQGATAGEYLDRLCLSNRLFGDDVRLERVVKARGKLSVVTSQTNIVGRAATEEEIDTLLDNGGFEKLVAGVYYRSNGSLLLHDLYPRNVVFSQGRAVPIDAGIQRATPEFAAFIRRNAHLF